MQSQPVHHFETSPPIHWLVLLAVFTICFATGLVADDSLVQTNAAEIAAVKQAAQKALKELFLPRAEINKKSYGFEDNDVVADAALKPPVELFILDDKRVLAYQSGQPVSSLLKPTGQWFVPVAIGGTNRAMIQVTQTATNKWTGSGWGWTPLARDWQSIKKWWPASGGFTPLFIISPPMAGYYFTVPQVQPANLTPFMSPQSAIAAKDGPPPALDDASQTIQGIRQVLVQRKKEP
jgi:hypothetical protein